MHFNIGLLGASKIAPSAIIIPAQSVPEATILAVAARDRARAQAYAQEHDIAQVFDSYESLINCSDIDVVYIGLPPSAHAYWSIRALEAGKHVICEKPAAMNVSEVRAMVAAAEASKGRLVEAMHTSYHTSFLHCLEWVRNGRVGDIVSMTSHFGVPLEDDGIRNQFRPEAGGGSVMDMGCYPLNWVAAFAGADVKTITAQAVLAPSGVDASMQATLQFENGAIADIHCSMVGPGGFSAGLTILGTKGTIEFQDPLVPYDGGTLTLTTDEGAESAPVSTVTTYVYQLQAVLSAFASGEPLPTEGDAIIAQQQLIDDVYAAAGLSALRVSHMARTKLG